MRGSVRTETTVVRLHVMSVRIASVICSNVRYVDLIHIKWEAKHCTHTHTSASLAWLAEHPLSKREVVGSNPTGGFCVRSMGHTVYQKKSEPTLLHYCCADHTVRKSD